MKGRPCSSFTTEAVAELVSNEGTSLLAGITNPGTYQYLEGIRLAWVYEATKVREIKRTHRHLAGISQSFVDRTNVPMVLKCRR
jgi:hypothetical protein